MRRAVFKVKVTPFRLHPAPRGRKKNDDGAALYGTREDEAHVIFECPAYIEARIQSNTRFLSVPKGNDDEGLDAQMRAFMNPSPGRLYPGLWRDPVLREFLASKPRRTSILSICSL
jgi:hypothetical protein